MARRPAIIVRGMCGLTHPSKSWWVLINVKRCGVGEVVDWHNESRVTVEFQMSREDYSVVTSAVEFLNSLPRTPDVERRLEEVKGLVAHGPWSAPTVIYRYEGARLSGGAPRPEFAMIVDTIMQYISADW